MKTIDEARVIELIDSYGAMIERWPEAEREQARELLARSPLLQDRFSAARDIDTRLDILLREHANPAPPPGLRTRILANLPSRGRGWRLRAWATSIGRGWMAVAVASVLFAAVGLVWLQSGYGVDPGLDVLAWEQVLDGEDARNDSEPEVMAVLDDPLADDDLLL